MTSGRPRTLPGQVPMALVITLVPLAAATDIIGGNVTLALKLPVFLDTIGTFVAAVVLGPWWGALAGTMANVVGGIVTPLGTSNIPFLLANVAAALAWGYGIRALGMGRNALTFFLLNAVVAVLVALVAAPIVLFVYGGATGHPSDAITAAVEFTGQSLASAVVASNLVVNLADKVIAGYVGLAILQALPAAYLTGVRLPASSRAGAAVLAAVGVSVGVLLAIVYLAFLQPPV